MGAVRKKRKWFQFGLRTVLLVPVFVGAIWYWGSWPERTAQRFHRYLVEGDVQAVRKMMHAPPQFDLDSLLNIPDQRDWQFDSPRIQSRSLSDWLCARGEFTVSGDHQSTLRVYFGSFVAERGRVIPKDDMESRQVSIYRAQYVSAQVALASIKSELNSSSPARITFDPKRNTILVIASKSTHEAIRTLLKRLDQPGQKSGPPGREER